MNKLINNKAYTAFFTEVKEQIKRSQIKAALSVNASLIHLYWQLGKLIVSKQKENSWGNGVIDQLSLDLRSEFPHSSGFSPRNLYNIRSFFLFYSDDNMRQAVSTLPVAEITELVGWIPGIKDQSFENE